MAMFCDPLLGLAREVICHGRRRTRKRSLFVSQLQKVLYTAKTHTTGGCDGASCTTDGGLDVKLSSPGGAGNGTNPEQLFAAGWSDCFLSALAVAAGQMKVARPTDRAIDAEVDLGTNDGGYCSGPASTLACRVCSPRS